MSRRVRPAVLRQRIVARLDREYAQVDGQVESLAVPTWWRGYLAGLRAARAIVREGGR
ncbi:hypothetical protein [Actinophytocola sediminis]